MKCPSILIAGLLGSLSGSVFAFNIAYVEVNSNHFANAGCYIDSESKKPFFTMASIFAANINGDNPNHPEIYLNPQVKSTLHSQQIEELHKKGIKVLVTLLGNHQGAGWACMTDPVAAKHFANEIANFVEQYHLDGIDIDDEYSNCTTNDTSLIMMAQAIKAQPKFKGKILTKALFADSEYFNARYQGHKLSEYLDYGWEMTYSYSDFSARLKSYVKAGMSISHLMIGGWANQTYPDPYAIGQFTKNNHTAGIMVYDVTKYSQDYLINLQKGENQSTTIDVIPNCLQ